MKLNYLNVLLVFILFIILTASSYIYFKDKKEEYISEIIVSQCDIQKSDCIIKIEKSSVSVHADKEIYYLKPFDVEVKNISLEKIESIYIDFKMKNMNMGVNRFKLIKSKQELWQGKALLPICVNGRVDWFTEIEITVGNKKYILVFPIKVKQAAT